MTINERLVYCRVVGFRDPHVGESFIRHAERSETDLVDFVETLKRNKPELFTRASRRTAAR